ncbi:DUF1983 domain-containing protein [Halomonas aquamarina]|uniref:DUF1983 domain-containing protein n=1 Tax=Vreelandella aquamarina TaxID=77097 RepID=A0ACC5VY44_9GAMM|nr:DUF1983 domain-containing protein [Halomonas aquamarina]MBZ5489136.1 DUF1983 domain-containing protein [Halomonas aquamarina]
MGKAVKAVSSVVTAAVRPFNKVFGLLMPKVPNAAGSGMTGSELKQVIRSSKEPARYVFGEVGTGALLAWAQEEPGEQDEGERLYLVYVLTEGTIHSLDQIYVNQEPVATAGDLIEYELVSGATAPNQYMLEHSPDWRETMIGRGLTWVRVTLKYDPEYFASGIPDLLFEYHGRNDIYDPRSTATGYSDNAALVILWYVRHRLRVPDDEILWDTFIDAANICDEAITNPDGSRERRYTVSGGFRADERKDRVLADLMAACAGSLLRVGGQIGLQVGAYYGPAEFTIDENMVIGTVTGQTEVSRADAVNTMRGTFVSREQRWVETDYPAVSVAEWIEEDGGPIEDSLNLRFVSSPYQAQRLANIELRRKRAGGRLELALNFRGYACRPGRVVRVDLPSLNIQGEFAVVDWDFSGENGCKVKLRAEQPEIYDDAVGQPFDATNFIRLPAGGIGSPTGLRYQVESVGEVVQGVLLWNPVDAALHYNVVIKHDGQSVQSAQVPAGVERCEIGGLVSGNYVAEVRARGRLGQSGPASVNFTVLAPATPERVIFTRGNREVTLIPQLPPGASLGGGYYRYYVTQSEGATQPQATYLGEGLSFTHTGLSPATRYYYYVQSVNAYGSSAFLRVSVETTNDFQEEIEAINDGLTRPGGVLEQFDGRLTENSEAIQSAQKSIADLKSELEELDPEKQGARIDELQQIIEREEKMQVIRYLGMRVQTMNGAAQQDTDRIVEANDRFSISQRVETLSTDYQGNKANVRQELTALSEEDAALARSLESYRVDVGEEFAEVNQQLTAVYDPATGAVARAVTTVETANGKAMIGMQVDGTTAEIVAVANTFAVMNPVSGELVTAFVVSDGRVIMPEAFIDRLDFTKLRSSDGRLVFENGKLRADLLEVTTMVSSVTAANGRPAFAFWSHGGFELNAVNGSARVEQRPTFTRMYQGNVLVVEIGELS